MNMLPEEREDTGLQAVFNSVFPISDFRGVSTLEFISYSIGNWECKCGNLKGLHHLRSTCKSCGATIATNPFPVGTDSHVPEVRYDEQEPGHVLQQMR